MRYQLSSNGFKLITSFESLKLEAYLDQGGVPTIGYGTTKINGVSVSLGMKINEPVAIALFYGDCKWCLKEIEIQCAIAKLNQNQIDALVSLIYNIGGPNFASSSLLQAINHKLLITEDLFTRWNKVRVNGELVISNGLTKRRKAEYALFTSKEGL